MKRNSLIGLLLIATCAAHSETVLFDQVRLIDPVAGQATAPTRLAVKDGWIVDADDEPADRVIAGEGKFLLAGMTEMHAHVPPADQPQRLHDVLSLFLAHGITTVRGMLGEPGHLAVREQLATGDLFGPRLITAGPSLNGRSVQSAEQAAAMVLVQAEAGYDLLKLHPGLWPEAFDAITATAVRVGIDYSGHISVAVGLDRVLASRQGTIDHLDAYAQALVPNGHVLHGRDPGFFGINLVDGMDRARIAELARRTAASGIANVPTQTLMENVFAGDLEALRQRPAMRFIDTATTANWVQAAERLRGEYSVEQRARFIALRRELIGALHEAGATLLLGADAPQILNVPGDAAHHELELYVAAGLTPAEALATATINVASYLNQSDAYACLAPGCVADLVLLGANPLEDIAHVRTIEGVMRAGRWFDRTDLDTRLDEIAQRARSPR